MSSAASSLSPDIVPLGVDGLLVRFATRLDDAANHAMLAFCAALDAAPLPGVVETSTSLASVLVLFDRDVTTRAELLAGLTTLLKTRDWAVVTSTGPRRIWHIPCAFGGDHGPQLGEVADLLSMTPDAALDDLLSHPVRVLAIGFAPGQPYLGMLPDRWNIPRQTTLTAQVPAGALVVAVRQLVQFDVPAPTGWRQIGRTAFRTFRPGGDTPIPLRPGDEVRYSPVSAEEFDRISRSNTDGSGGARLEVAI